MCALTFDSCSRLTAIPAGRHRSAPLFALAFEVIDDFRALGTAAVGTIADAGARWRAGAGLLALDESSEALSDVVEPSMAELLDRLAALRDHIRRARQHYIDGGRDSDGRGASHSPNDGDERHD